MSIRPSVRSRQSLNRFKPNLGRWFPMTLAPCDFSFIRKKSFFLLGYKCHYFYHPRLMGSIPALAFLFFRPTTWFIVLFGFVLLLQAAFYACNITKLSFTAVLQTTALMWTRFKGEIFSDSGILQTTLSKIPIPYLVTSTTGSMVLLLKVSIFAFVFRAQK